jgi:hypothetical protein
MLRDDDQMYEDPGVDHGVAAGQSQKETEIPTTGGGTVPAAHGGTGTDTGTRGIGPGAGPPDPHQPAADVRTHDFDINAGTERAVRRDEK